MRFTTERVRADISILAGGNLGAEEGDKMVGYGNGCGQVFIPSQKKRPGAGIFTGWLPQSEPGPWAAGS